MIAQFHAAAPELRPFLSSIARHHGLSEHAVAHMMRFNQQSHPNHGIQSWGIAKDLVLATRVSVFAHKALIRHRRGIRYLAASSVDLWRMRVTLAERAEVSYPEGDGSATYQRDPNGSSPPLLLMAPIAIDSNADTTAAQPPDTRTGLTILQPFELGSAIASYIHLYENALSVIRQAIEQVFRNHIDLLAAKTQAIQHLEKKFEALEQHHKQVVQLLDKTGLQRDAQLCAYYEHEFSRLHDTLSAQHAQNMEALMKHVNVVPQRSVPGNVQATPGVQHQSLPGLRNLPPRPPPQDDTLVAQLVQNLEELLKPFDLNPQRSTPGNVQATPGVQRESLPGLKQLPPRPRTGAMRDRSRSRERM